MNDLSRHHLDIGGDGAAVGQTRQDPPPASRARKTPPRRRGMMACDGRRKLAFLRNTVKTRTVLQMLNPRITRLVRSFLKFEGEKRRGPRFAKAALALDEEIRKSPIPQATLIECFGPPDLWGKGLLVYFFDHKEAGRERDEWFFYQDKEQVTSSGYNRRGINDLSHLKAKRDWPISS